MKLEFEFAGGKRKSLSTCRGIRGPSHFNVTPLPFFNSALPLQLPSPARTALGRSVNSLSLIPTPLGFSNACNLTYTSPSPDPFSFSTIRLMTGIYFGLTLLPFSLYSLSLLPLSPARHTVKRVTLITGEAGVNRSYLHRMKLWKSSSY